MAGITDEMRKKAHSPEARRKAIITFKKTMAAKKAEAAATKARGTHSTIDVSSLPKRPVKGPRKGTRRAFTDGQKVRMIDRIDSWIASGWEIKEACEKVGVHDSQYRSWKKQIAQLRRSAGKVSSSPKLNGHKLKLAGGEDAVAITLKVGGVAYEVSVEEARSIKAGLDALLGT